MPGGGASRPGKAAVAVHAVTLALAFGLWAYLDRHLWFYGDEWDFLTRRGLHGAWLSIWAPHNEHWSTLPILLWRAIFSVAHLTSYWPYLVPLLLAHVAVVHLVWRRCWREGAGPWLAGSLAILMALFGSGAEDLTWAFQIGFLSSLVLGLLALEVVEGPLFGAPLIKSGAGRDGAASLLALAALMCSGVGVATMVALGVVLFSREGWSRAARCLAVPVTAYLVWFALAGRKGISGTGDSFGLSVFLRAPRFVATNLARDLGSTVGRPAAGDALAVVVVCWLVWQARRLFRRHPAVLGEACAALVFYGMAALGRDRISATMSPSRYAYIGTALLLPTLALMACDLSRLAQALWDRHAAPLVRRAAGPRGSRPGASGPRTVKVTPWVLAQGAVLGIAALATLANLNSGVKFARSRASFVGELKEQIITSAALLESHQQLARALNAYPIAASGDNAGYLSTRVLLDLEERRLLPRPGPLVLSAAAVRQDESWLDVLPTARPRYRGDFRLLSGQWASVRVGELREASVLKPATGARPVTGADQVWPAGPGVCVVVRPLLVEDRGAHRGDRLFPPFTVQLAPVRGDRSSAVWVSLGHAGGSLTVWLLRPWGEASGAAGSWLRGEKVTISPGGHAWVNDSVPGDGLSVRAPPSRGAELCGLAAHEPAGGALLAGHPRLPVGDYPRSRQHFRLTSPPPRFGRTAALTA